MDFNINTIITKFVGNNTQQDFILAFVGFLVTVIVLKLVKMKMGRRIQEMIDDQANSFDDLLLGILSHIGDIFYVFIGLCVAIQFVVLPVIVENAILAITFSVVILFLASYLLNFLNKTIEQIQKTKTDEGEPLDVAFVDIIKKIVKAIVWSVAILVVLQNLGVNVTTFIATLGVGGIALAIALKSILEDMFASFSIHVDKPFIVGDYIQIGSDSGTVKHIGVKSTRLKTVDGPELVIPNKDLTGKRIVNYKKREKRRAVIDIDVSCNTPTDKLEKVPSIIESVVTSYDVTEFDRAHLVSFGDFSYKFQFVYYMVNNEFKLFMDTKQDLHLKLLREFEKAGIVMPYPTQAIVMEK